MKRLIAGIVKDKFVSATFWMFLGTGFMNVGNYLFHLIMGRMLGVSLYGALESLISALYILSVPTMTLTLVVVKFVSSYKGKGETASITSFYFYLSRKLLLYGSLLLIIFILGSGFIKSFLHLPSLWLAILLPICFFLNLFYFFNKSFIQGVSNFLQLSILTFLEAIVKLGLGILLVYLGYRVEGAFGAIIISILVAFALSHLYLKKIITKSIHQFDEKKDLLKFTIPTFMTSLSLISIFTTDIILARHFFPGVESGYYSALSVLGKIIYFAASPILLVLFPMISEHHARGEKYTRLLFIGIILTAIISIFITLIYFLAPDIMVLAMFGSKYLAITGLLGLFGIFISFHTVNSLLANFYLSIHKIFPTYIVLLAAAAQIVGIILFHKNIGEIVYVSIIVSFLLLIFLLLYYPRAKLSQDR